MRKLLKVLLIVGAVLVVLVLIAIPFTVGWRTFLGPRARRTSDRRFERTPQRLARGRYLTVGLAGCETCHSPKDWATHGAPILPGKELSGQIIPLSDLPGRIVAPNLTPDPETGSSRWTDDELARAIREGIGHDGRTLFPMMPYASYRNLSEEDIASIIVYLRSIPPVHNPLPKTQVSFPVNYLIRNAPQPVTAPVSGPDPNDVLARGRYLVKLGCGCHTVEDRGQAIPGTAFAGGEFLKGPWGQAASANLTPDPTGIGYYDEALFLKALRTGYVGARKLNSIMPFGEFQNLGDDDLKAIFAFLRSVQPVKHRIDNTLPVTYCKLCRQWHGAGDQN